MSNSSVFWDSKNIDSYICVSLLNSTDVTKCFQTSRNSTSKIFRKKNCNINFDLFCMIVKKKFHVCHLLFWRINHNKKKSRWIHLNHSYISNESSGKTRHKTRYDADSQGLGKTAIEIQFVFFFWFHLLWKKWHHWNILLYYYYISFFLPV